MIDPRIKDFTKSVKFKKIKISENGRTAIFLNPQQDRYYVVSVDGNLLKNVTASDYVISRHKIADIIIELKGMDVDHAVDQILATADYWQKNNLRTGKIAALVVSSRAPRFDTKVQRATTKFYEKFKGHLHIVRNGEFVFEKVLCADGP